MKTSLEPGKRREQRNFNLRIRTVRYPERATILEEAKRTARSREETEAQFWLRAIAREVSLCKATMSVADRNGMYDQIETEILAMLSDDEKREYGL